MGKKIVSIFLTALVLFTFVPASVVAASVVNSVRLNKRTYTMSVGNKTQLRATVRPFGSGQKLVWTSSNKKVATVSAKGLVRARNAGKVQITVTAKGTRKKAVCTITVKKPTLTLSRTNVDTNEGATFSLFAKVSPRDMAKRKVAWSSSNIGIATVDGAGVVTAHAPGAVNIIAQMGKASAVCSVTVNAVPKSLYDLQLFYKKEDMTTYEWRVIDTDNLGNKYSRGWRVSGWGWNPKSNTYTYLIDGAYGRIDGAFVVNNSSRDNIDSKYCGILEIYGDKKLLYKSPEIRGGVLPVRFNVDLTGISQLEIKVTSVMLYVGLVDAVLYRVGY